MQRAGLKIDFFWVGWLGVERVGMSNSVGSELALAIVCK